MVFDLVITNNNQFVSVNNIQVFDSVKYWVFIHTLGTRPQVIIAIGIVYACYCGRKLKK